MIDEKSWKSWDKIPSIRGPIRKALSLVGKAMLKESKGIKNY